MENANLCTRIILHNLSIFSYQCILTLTYDLFDPKINRAHPCLMGSLCVKFHDERCKGDQL